MEAVAKDLGTQGTLLKTPGNLWNDNNNIDLFYLCPLEVDVVVLSGGGGGGGQ